MEPQTSQAAKRICQWRETICMTNVPPVRSLRRTAPANAAIPKRQAAPRGCFALVAWTSVHTHGPRGLKSTLRGNRLQIGLAAKRPYRFYQFAEAGSYEDVVHD